MAIDLIFRFLKNCLGGMARNHRGRAPRLRRHCLRCCCETNSATFLTGSLKAGRARAVPGLCSAAAQRGSSSLAVFSRKVWRCQLHPSLQQKFPSRGQGQVRGKRRAGRRAAVSLRPPGEEDFPVFPLSMNLRRERPVQDRPPRSGTGVSLRREAGGCRAGRL